MSTQPGLGYNFVHSGNATALTIDQPWLFYGDPDQYQVTVAKGDVGYQVQCRKGFVRFTSSRNLDPWAWGTWQAEVQKFYGYPTGSKTTGSASTADDSPLVDLGGYITIQPASVEGGSDAWGIYIIGCGDSMSGFWPYLAIMADGSDADNKSAFFNGVDPQIIVRQQVGEQLVEVTTPTGSEYITLQIVGQFVQYNYNCQKWKIANIEWDGDTFVVTQHHLGPLSLSNPVQFQGLDSPNAAPYTPAYDAKLTDWLGSWTDYTKDSTGATVQL